MVTPPEDEAEPEPELELEKPEEDCDDVAPDVAICDDVAPDVVICDVITHAVRRSFGAVLGGHMEQLRARLTLLIAPAPFGERKELEGSARYIILICRRRQRTSMEASTPAPIALVLSLIAIGLDSLHLASFMSRRIPLV